MAGNARGNPVHGDFVFSMVPAVRTQGSIQRPVCSQAIVPFAFSDRAFPLDLPSLALCQSGKGCEADVPGNHLKWIADYIDLALA